MTLLQSFARSITKLRGLLQTEMLFEDGITALTSRLDVTSLGLKALAFHPDIIKSVVAGHPLHPQAALEGHALVHGNGRVNQEPLLPPVGAIAVRACVATHVDQGGRAW